MTHNILCDARAAQGEGSDLSVTVLNMHIDEPRPTDARSQCDGGEHAIRDGGQHGIRDGGQHHLGPSCELGIRDGGQHHLGRSTLIGQVFIPADALRTFLLQHHTHDVTQATCFPPFDP
jgi:hypothetical protein